MRAQNLYRRTSTTIESILLEVQIETVSRFILAVKLELKLEQKPSKYCASTNG